MKRLLFVLGLVLLVAMPIMADDHEGCLRAKGMQRTVENLDNGVRITLHCENAELRAEAQARAAKGCGSACPMSAKGVVRTVENTEDGAVITATSSDPEQVKALQKHAARECDHGTAKACDHGKEQAKGHTCPHRHGTDRT
ncbi:MAG TPA: hypothetical protein P5234_05450 [Thermoanaerobaculaceae bacterium]|nr:hypothetical protein [Thermoanaerobaculaceae bacterium]HRS15680.1 hypothetical protein [Thermoanaerobaculaceae bacterium]